MLAIFKSFLFGLSLALAFVVGNFLFWKKAKAKDLGTDLIFDFSLASLAGGLVFGRLFYIFANWSVFRVDIFRWIHLVRYPGFSGKAIILGFLFTLLYFCRKKKVNPWPFLDSLIIPFIYALFIAQFGCLINGCIRGITGHPLALYFLISTIILMWLVKKIETYLPQLLSGVHKKKNIEIKQEGLLFLSILASFALINFVLDIFKQNALYLGKVNIAVSFDLLLLLTGLFFLVKRIGLKNLKDSLQ